MAEILPRHYIFGIIAFTFIIVGGVSIFASLHSDDPTFGDSDKLTQFNRTFNVMDDVSDNVGNLQTNIENADSDFGLFGVLNSLISSAWQTLKLLFSSFSFMGAVFSGTTTMFGIPAWIPTLAGLVITIIIAFAIYSAIFQREI